MTLTVAQFTTDLQLAGQQRVVADLAKAFHDNGYISLVCTTQHGGPLVNELKSIGISFNCLNLKTSYDPRCLLKLKRYLRDNNVNVVITHGNSGCLMPRIVSSLSSGITFIHVEHNVSSCKKKYHIIADKILSLFTDKIVCVSENAKNSLLNIEKICRNKVIVIPNGLNEERFLHKANNNRNCDDVRRIGIIGRFDLQKGHVYFVEAARQIVKSYKNIEFIYIGDGSLRRVIENKVHENGLDKYSHFLGEREDITELLDTLDVFVLSSLWEGLPISLLEAQYHGVASVVTDVGGNPEIVKNGYNGILVPPQNSSALASAILKVISTDKLRKKLGSNGMNFIRENYSFKKTAESYIELINSLAVDKAV